MPVRRKRRLIVVFDGAVARLLEQEPKGFREIGTLKSDASHKPSREVFADRPTKGADRATGRRFGIQAKSDPQREAKREFAASLAARLDAEASGGKGLDGIVLVAAPRSLGDLRRCIGRPTMALVEAQFAKDLTKEPKLALANHLSRMLAAR
ncbi:MAG: host attachment protein [Alphaproteobacteria bacterium]|nr:host attachment protein [Alphaproteobacteria bacterium]